MKIIAWTWLGLHAFVITLYPLLLGKPRKPYGMSDWISYLVGGVMGTALCGRVLGWW